MEQSLYYTIIYSENKCSSLSYIYYYVMVDGQFNCILPNCLNIILRNTISVSNLNLFEGYRDRKHSLVNVIIITNIYQKHIFSTGQKSVIGTRQCVHAFIGKKFTQKAHSEKVYNLQELTFLTRWPNIPYIFPSIKAFHLCLR